ncbi:hypothetical protein POPTR_012G020100v4 [Populus trichocarpa]|uniref:Uncharacterized protein n=1 Tax=Populus trichocarpa TaxID=3694 RepID=A0ACC0S5S7_POPTR|nr:hypothetical protein POPTR_012G020100v4 [Populus trichocarpa]
MATSSLNFSPYIPVFSRIRSATSSSLMDAANNKVVEVFDTEEDCQCLLRNTQQVYRTSLTKERGSFTVVLSVGLIDWSKWHVFWVDERLVPKDHPDSNYKLAFDGFLSMGAVDDYKTCLKHLVHTGVIEKSSVSGFPKFDLMLISMGPDGHVASLFPGHSLLKENQKWVTHITDSPKPPPKRSTFTFPVINSSSYIALLVCGAGKADVLQSAVGNGKNSDMLPVQTVSPEGEF